MKKKLLQLCSLLSITGILMLLATGCFGLFNKQPYIAVKYYDLDSPPEIELKNVQVKFDSFDSTEPVKYKMVYHNVNNEVIIDDYNKWVQPPCMLLTRYLQSAFKQNSMTLTDSKLIVSGNVFMFKIDLLNNTVSLGVSYEIKTASNDMIKNTLKTSTVFSKKLKAQGPKYFVSAMSECARDLVLSIADDMKKMQQNKNETAVEKSVKKK